jgi:hypothetical protein
LAPLPYQVTIGLAADVLDALTHVVDYLRGIKALAIPTYRSMCERQGPSLLARENSTTMPQQMRLGEAGLPRVPALIACMVGVPSDCPGRLTYGKPGKGGEYWLIHQTYQTQPVWRASLPESDGWTLVDLGGQSTLRFLPRSARTRQAPLRTHTRPGSNGLATRHRRPWTREEKDGDDARGWENEHVGPEL